MKLLVCGNYRDDPLAMNGQTIKTRVLTAALVDAHGPDAVIELDTSRVFKNPVAFYRVARRGFQACTHVVLLPGPLAIHALVPLFVRWGKSEPKDIRYVVIGGFLPDYVARYPWLRHACAKLDGIYVETVSMAESLRAARYGNVHVLPNFRSFDRHMPRNYTPTRVPLKLVFCSRIFKEKGIEEAMAAVGRLNQDAGRVVATLDVFGPIEEPYQSRFESVVGASSHVSYKGVLEADRLYSMLQQYDLMLFPTYYYGEGFAGCIVDAFIAGVPVLASDWGYNPELVQRGQTGEIVRARSTDELVAALRRFVDTPQALAEMRRHCIEQAGEYHTDQALEGLMRDLALSAPAAG